MEYKGELYGKIGKHYFPLELTADNVDRLESIIIELRKDIDNKAGQIADLTSLIQSECEAFGEFIRVNKWQGDMNNTWRQMFTGSSKTTSELYELYELYLTTKNKAR